MAQIRTRRRKAGRPKGSVTVPGSRTIGLCLQPDQLDTLDAWGRERGLGSRSAALRDLLDQLSAT
jgi:hypothetical protein